MNEVNNFSGAEKLLFSVNQADVKTSLYIITATNSRLRHIRLEDFALEGRDNLKKWGQEHRFVIVVEMGNKIFAHMHKDFSEQIQNLDESAFKEKNVTVNALSDEEANRMAEQISDLFEEILLGSLENKAKKEENDEKVKEGVRGKQPQTVSAKQSPVGLSYVTEHVIPKLKLKLGEITTECMRRYNDARREMDKIETAKALAKEIVKEEIMHDILKESIIKDDVAHHGLKNEQILKNEAHVDRTRGAE